MTAPPEDTLAWVRAALGGRSRILGIDALPPASRANHRLRVETADGTDVELLLRRYTDTERLGSDPWYSPTDELDALRALEAVELPVPRVAAADVHADTCDVPTLLLTWLPGEAPDRPTDLRAFARGLAEPLPAIHAIDAPPSMRAYEPYFVSDGIAVADLRPPRWAFDVRTWERAFETVASDPPDAPSAFIHRDYHHGNTVWQGGTLTGVVDWTTGCVGPPGIDLAQARINLAWDFDQGTADAFRHSWRALEPGLKAHPYWDVLDAVDWLGDGAAPDATPERLRRYETFVAKALAELG
ncbi:MAG TPA: aminoglycoside phosphotransferase family protein [Actinomycetota bacterium]|nr:aminoglycoside phosphotransferase family protein [Actinomycetota bacterium]